MGGEQAHARVAIEGGLDGVAERLGFEPVLPSELPHGMELRSVLAIGMTFGGQAAPGLTSVQLELRDDENAHRLSLGEHRVEPGWAPSLALNGTRDVEISGVTVRRHDRPPEPGLPDGLRLASWVACGLEFGLGGPFDEFSGPEFEAVVASIIDRCEGERASGVR